MNEKIRGKTRLTAYLKGGEKAPSERPNPPHVPPITATYPARWIEVNGFRYVLAHDPEALVICNRCAKPKGSAHVECNTEATRP